MTRGHPSGRLRKTAAWLCAAMMLAGVVVAAAATSIAIGDRQTESLAQDLRERGVPAVVVDVSITLPARLDRGEVRVELTSGETVVERGADPGAASDDPADHHVLVLPEDRSRAMNASDITYYAEQAVQDGLVTIAVGVLLAVLGVAGLAVATRGRGRHGARGRVSADRAGSTWHTSAGGSAASSR